MKLPAFLRRVQVDDNYNLVEVPLVTRIRRVLTAVLVLVINVILIVRATVSCDIALSTKILLSQRGGRDLASSALCLPKPASFSSFSTRNKRAQGARLYHLYAQNATMDELGHLQVTHVDYFDGAGLLQFTMRQNLRHYPEFNRRGNPTLSYVVRVIDKDGREKYANTAIMHTVSEEHRGYLFTRVAFDDLDFVLGTDYVTLYVFLTDTSDTLLSITLHGSGSANSRDALSAQTYLEV